MVGAQSADVNLSDAIRGLEQLDQLGPTAYAQNGAILVAEIAARAALADAVTNRIHLLQDLIRDAVPRSPHAERLNRERLHLIGAITGGSNVEA